MYITLLGEGEVQDSVTKYPWEWRGSAKVLVDIFPHFLSIIFSVFNFLFIIIIDYFTIIILFIRILHHTEVRVWNNVTKCHMEEGEGSKTHQKYNGPLLQKGENLGNSLNLKKIVPFINFLKKFCSILMVSILLSGLFIGNIWKLSLSVLSYG